MKNAICKIYREQVEEGEPYSARLDAHLATCSDCRAFAQERAKLRSLMTELERVDAPINFNQRLFEKLSSAGEMQTRLGLFRLIPRVPVSVAASLVVLILALVAAWQFQPANAPVPVPVETSAGRDEQAARTEKPDQLKIDDVDSTLPLLQGANETTRETAANIVTGSLPRPARNTEKRSLARTSMSTATDRILIQDPSSQRGLSFNPVTFGGQETVERTKAALRPGASPKGVW